MAVGQGFSKVITSGSVFHYDTGDIINSFKGKPTTNLLLDIGYTYGTQNQTYFKSSYGTEYDIIPGMGGPVLVNYCNFFNDYNGGSGNCCPSVFYFGNFSVSPSTVYTYQIVYKTPDGYANANYMYHYEFGPSGYVTEYGLWDSSRTQDLGNGWVHAWGTFTSNANTNYFQTYLFHYQYTQTKIQVARISLTQGDTIIPPRQLLAPTVTRSTTQGLVDLTGNNIVYLDNASYATNGQISLDATNDYVKVGQNSTFYTNDWTWEMVVKFTTNTGTYQGLVWAEGATGGGSGYQYLLSLYSNTYFHYRIYNSSTAWTNTDTSNITFDPLQYNHIVWQFNNGTTRIYINGTLFHTDTSRGTYSGGTDSAMFLGARNDGWGGAPILPAVYKQYNRTLTAGEITQNYNHYKTRFNLP